MNKQTLLAISNISLSSPTGSRSILENVSYTVHPGDFVVVLGGNGSGKSSLLKTINTMYTPTRGDIFLEDKNIITISRAVLAQTVTTVTQDTTDNLFSDFTVFENCLMYESIYGYHVLKLTRATERDFYARYLATFSTDLVTKLDTSIDRLSGGQRQTLALALCLRYQPKLLLLDEHTSALDPKTAQFIMTITDEYIRAHAVTCIMTTHDLDEALRYGNRLIALKAGKVVFMADGQDKQRLTKEQLLHYCY